MRLVAILLFGIWPLAGLAMDIPPANQFSYPAGCLALGYEFNADALQLKNKADEQTTTRIYLYYNESKDDILLNRSIRYPSASAGWASRLRPGHWSAFMVSDRWFTFTCRKIEKNGHYPLLNCSDVLRVCQFPKFSVQQNFNAGTYWLVEDVSLEQALSEIQRRGITLQTANIGNYDFDMGLS